MRIRAAIAATALLTHLVCCNLGLAGTPWPLTFPLEGNYRPGRFMPAMLAPDTATAAQQFYGAGIVGVRLQGANPNICILPIPVLSQPDLPLGEAAASANSPGIVWREVSPQRVFLGLVDSMAPPGLDVGSDPALSQLSRSWLVGSPACAWNALDWLVISPDSVAALGDDWLCELIATGTGVCVSGDALPPGRLPWRGIAGGWVLSAPSAGSRIGPWASDAYAPAETWQPQQSPQLRRQVVAVAAGLSGLMFACALSKGRRRAIVAIACAAGATAGIALWSADMPASAVVEARILVMEDIVRADHWLFAGGVSGGTTRIPWRSGLMPIFASRQQAERINLQLVCDAGEPVGYECTVPRGQTLALRWQKLLPSESGSNLRPLTPSPMRGVVEAYYLPPGWSLRGQPAPTQDDHWPPLLVGR